MVVEALTSRVLARGISVLRHTRARDIARVAGVSIGTLTHHFTGVDSMIAAVLRHISDRQRLERVTRLRGRRSAFEGLLYLVDEFFGRRDARVRWQLWVEYWARSIRSVDFKRWQEDRYRTYRDLISDLVVEGIRNHEFHRVAPATFATEFVAYLDGLGVQLAVLDNPSPQEARRLLTRFIEEKLDVSPAVASRGRRGTRPSASSRVRRVEVVQRSGPVDSLSYRVR
jgi:AcrR family transcriptional regulator